MQLFVMSEMGSLYDKPIESGGSLSAYSKIEIKGARVILLRPKVSRDYQRYKRNTYLLGF